MSASQLVVIAAGFVISISQARLLGAVGRGDVTRFSNASALSVLYFGLGINSAITYFIASGSVEPHVLTRMLKRLYAATTLGVVCCVSLASLTPLRRFLPHDLSLLQTILALSAFFALSQLSSWLSALQSGRGHFRAINTSTVAVSITNALASTALLWARPSWAGPGTIISLLVALEVLRAAILLSARDVHRSEPGNESLNGPSPEARERGAPLALRSLLGYSLLTYAGEALQFLTYRFDMWVVDAYHGAAELGRYSLAVSLAQMVWIVPTASARVLFPYSAMLDRPQAAVLAWRTARLSAIVCAAAAILGAGLAHVFLTTLFGDDFASVPSLLTILLLGVVPYSIAKVLGNYLAGINALRANVATSFAGLLMTIALDFALIPRYGALGASWATAVAYCGYTALLLIVFARKSGLSLRALLSSPLRGD